MNIDVTIGEGFKIDALSEGFTIRTDQPEKRGGEASAPDPFTLFLASLGTCAGYFVAKFCRSRKISTEGFHIRVSNDFNDRLHVAESIRIDVTFPNLFPEKYREALIRSIDHCTVKKTILHRPYFEVTAH